MHSGMHLLVHSMSFLNQCQKKTYEMLPRVYSRKLRTIFHLGKLYPIYNANIISIYKVTEVHKKKIKKGDHLCGLVVRVLGYRSGGSIPSTTRKKNVVCLEWGPLSLVSTTEELLDRKVAAPV
jgi:hypothetical protein